MIVRVLGEGQWRVDDGLRERLQELDEQVSRALDAGDEAALHTQPHGAGRRGALARREVARGGSLSRPTRSSRPPTSRSPRPAS